MHSLIQIHVLLVFVEFIPIHVRALWQMRIKVERDLPLKLLLPFLQSLFHLMTLIYLKMIKKGTTYLGVHNKLLLLLYMYFTFFHISYYPNKSDFLELFNHFLNKKSWKKTTNKKKTTWITIQDESADLCCKKHLVMMQLTVLWIIDIWNFHVLPSFSWSSSSALSFGSNSLKPSSKFSGSIKVHSKLANCSFLGNQSKVEFIEYTCVNRNICVQHCKFIIFRNNFV